MPLPKLKKEDVLYIAELALQGFSIPDIILETGYSNQDIGRVLRGFGKLYTQWLLEEGYTLPIVTGLPIRDILISRLAEEVGRQRTIKYNREIPIIKVTHPDGKITICKNLRQFCREHNLQTSNASSCLHGRLPHTGGFIFENIDC